MEVCMSHGTVALISGGADSATLLGWLLQPGGESVYPVYPISFTYGSQHQREETKAAGEVVRHYSRGYGPALLRGHWIMQLPPVMFEGSALTDHPEDLPEGRSIEEMVSSVAPSYVPARNSIFLSLAAGRADAWDCEYVAYAAHQEDSPAYPDCRPSFVSAMRSALVHGTKNGVSLLDPFIDWSKAEILLWGVEHHVPYELTYSCYKGVVPSCGVCDTCILRIESFKRAGLRDPIPYAVEVDWGDL